MNYEEEMKKIKAIGRLAGNKIVSLAKENQKMKKLLLQIYARGCCKKLIENELGEDFVRVKDFLK